MDELRKKYDGLELTDSQTLEAYTQGLTPEQVEDVKKAIEQIGKAFEEMWKNLMNAFKGI